MSVASNGSKPENSSKDSDDPLSDQNLKTLVPELFSDPAKRTALLVIRNLQKDHDNLHQEYMREKLLLEQKYISKLCPLFDQRCQLIDKADLRDFWPRVFQKCQTLSDNITERDVLALSYLRDVSCIDVTADNKNSHRGLTIGSFMLVFAFATNPFFTNKVLKKTYVMCEHDFEDPVETVGCKISWKPGKDLTLRTLRKKTKSGRVLVKTQRTDSFFNFFSPPKLLQDPLSDPSHADEIEEVLDADFEIGECLKDEVIPKALLYYLGIAESDAESETNEPPDSGDINGTNKVLDLPPGTDHQGADHTKPENGAPSSTHSSPSPVESSVELDAPTGDFKPHGTASERNHK